MHEILVVSGKGGTGKTSLTAAFAHLAQDAIICDLDVDAPDLHLLLQPRVWQFNDFYSGHQAIIVPERCDGCDICRQICRFDAVRFDGGRHIIDPLRCEGCKVCVTFCPSKAIAFSPRHCGTWYRSDTRFGAMVHAQLFPGQENSGRLVAYLRSQARETADALRKSLIISDGPPGIGCPVISAAAGVDLAVIVTEPTPSGLHDLERIVALCDHFKLAKAVIINKCDLNKDVAGRIETFCHRNACTIAARLPHDPAFVHAMIERKTVTEYQDSGLAAELRQAWDNLMALVVSPTEVYTTVEAEGVDSTSRGL